MNRKGIMPTKRSLIDKCVLYAFNDMTSGKCRTTGTENISGCPVKVEGGDWMQRGMRELLEAHENVLQIKEKMAIGSWAMARKGAKEHCRTF